QGRWQQTVAEPQKCLAPRTSSDSALKSSSIVTQVHACYFARQKQNLTTDDTDNTDPYGSQKAEQCDSSSCKSVKIRVTCPGLPWIRGEVLFASVGVYSRLNPFSPDLRPSALICGERLSVCSEAT